MSKISVIVPAYKAEAFIKKNLLVFQQSLKKLCPKTVKDFEIVCVVDGHDLDKTLHEARKVKGVKVFSYPANRGKGYALQTGFNNATGDIVTFLDADGDFNPDQLKVFFPYLATADFIVGSKRHPFSKIKYPFVRRVLSRGFQIISWLILGIHLRDTQSGLKLVKREVLEVIFPLMKVERFAFDLELCFLAQKHGFRTVEAPICIDFKGKSTISLSAPLLMFIDILKIRWRYSVSRYYQNKFHEEKFSFKTR